MAKPIFEKEYEEVIVEKLREFFRSQGTYGGGTWFDSFAELHRLFNEYHETSVSIHTFQKWMKRSGFKCERVLMVLDSNAPAPEPKPALRNPSNFKPGGVEELLDQVAFDNET